ncbi:hypothetical protein NF556_17770 [Ornithinimicrobium faecis]|uniref:Uncharacterized protein n=1 Tax=Ornithinimicrobium faecis TaxID=2934158 RepID=A0ABY4YS59_9MICO|nr:hypothetical protein [Ornithinimicrobium sp. HY1793]USQ79429.1 hypothetical protein NF556_17770 [Ornithinimicrobium sp. HY1793]
MLELADSTLFVALESFTSGTGRVLLRLAATLFLAYMLTMGVTLAIWSGRGVTERFRPSLTRGSALVVAHRPAAAGSQVSRAS